MGLKFSPAVSLLVLLCALGCAKPDANESANSTEWRANELASCPFQAVVSPGASPREVAALFDHSTRFCDWVARDEGTFVGYLVPPMHPDGNELCDPKKLPAGASKFQRDLFADVFDFGRVCIGRASDVRFVPTEELDKELESLRKACFLELQPVDDIRQENLGKHLRELFAVDVEYTSFEDGVYAVWLDPLEYEKAEATDWDDFTKFASRAGVEVRHQPCN